MWNGWRALETILVGAAHPQQLWMWSRCDFAPQNEEQKRLPQHCASDALAMSQASAQSSLLS